MEYILKHCDTNLLLFTATTDTSEPDIELVWVNKAQQHLLPLDLTLDPKSIRRWLKNRTIPRNRAYVHTLLAKCGLSINRPMHIISLCKGLSLNDVYWVVENTPENERLCFAKTNLYENPFSNILASLVFTGYGSSPRASLASSPEFTTTGALPKCWRRNSGTVYLYKGGTSGASNTGNEPYSEFYAAQVAQAMGIDAISYNIVRWKGQLCSTCALFTSKEYAYLPIGQLLTSGHMEAAITYYRSMGHAFEDALADMLVFDAVICNTDRHFGNFGVLVDNRTNQIVSPAPLFDHGNALFNLASNDCWDSETALEEYIAVQYPSRYDDFIGTAKQVMTDRQRKMLHHLLNFTFHKHSRYNLPAKRLKMIEQQIRARARLLLS